MVSECLIEADLEFSAFSNECFLVGVILWTNFLEYRIYIYNTATSCVSIAAALFILYNSRNWLKDQPHIQIISDWKTSL